MGGLAPGDVIVGKYCVERVLGAGGMGVVVAARHLQLGQLVAIKCMRDNAGGDEGAVARFLREARAAVALSSEHAARVLDVGALGDGAPYIVMEYLAGIDLAEVLRRDGPLPVGAAVGFVLQACDAIAEAHSLAIVHRDLKPSNLFVTTRRDGSALLKVLDFGISKVSQSGQADVEPSLTASGTVMGSPGYMSPEQVRNAKNADARSDIWSLGVIMYEVLTGVPPFQGTSLGDTFAKIVSEDPPALAALRPEVPRGLAAIVHKCLCRNVNERFQSIGELASSLRPFAPGESALLVDRILRAADAAGPPPRHASPTVLAPTPTLTAPHEAHGGGGGGWRTATDDEPVQTGPGWQRSAAHSPVRGRRGAMFVAGTVVMSMALIGGVYRATRLAGPPHGSPPSEISAIPQQAPATPGPAAQAASASAPAPSPPVTAVEAVGAALEATSGAPSAGAASGAADRRRLAHTRATNTVTADVPAPPAKAAAPKSTAPFQAPSPSGSAPHEREIF